MNTQLSDALADCLTQIERGASVDDCLQRHARLSAELRPHLYLFFTGAGHKFAQPSKAALTRGRQAMHGALASTPPAFGLLRAARMAPTWTTVVAAVGAVAFVLGGAAGASAALGGPNVAGDALDAVGVTNGDGSGGIGHSSASDRGLECANPNAFGGSANSEDKAQNAVDAQEKENCSEGDGGQDGSTNSADGINNAPDAADNGKDHADENAAEGSGNADDGSTNRSENASPLGPAGAEAGGPAADTAGPPEDAGSPPLDPGVPPEAPGAGQGQDRGQGQD